MYIEAEPEVSKNSDVEQLWSCNSKSYAGKCVRQVLVGIPTLFQSSWVYWLGNLPSPDFRSKSDK